MAITAALQVLAYHEAIDPSEVPDENIWHHAARLEEWFEAVKQRRESGMEKVPEAEDVPMTQNELTKGLRD